LHHLRLGPARHRRSEAALARRDADPDHRAAALRRRLLGRPLPLAESGVLVRAHPRPQVRLPGNARGREGLADLGDRGPEPGALLRAQAPLPPRQGRGAGRAVHDADRRGTSPPGGRRRHRRHLGRDGVHRRRGGGEARRPVGRDRRPPQRDAVGPGGGARVRPQDLEGARPARGHAERRLRRRDRGDDRRGGVRAPRRADQAYRRARHAGAVLAAARAGRVLMATGTAVEVVMPQMGVCDSEGTVTKWLKSVGDHVDADESIVEISTDKVDTEVPSPGTGTLTEILVHEGQTVAVGTLLGRIGDAGAGPAAPPPPSGASVAEPATQAATDAATTASSEGDVAPGEDRVTAAEPESHDGHDRTFVSPVVARIAAEHGIDPASVPGSGRGGRVTKKDMLAFVERQQGATPAVPAPEIPAPAREPASAQPPPGPPQPEGGEVVEPMNAMRRGIAEHMRRSLDTAAHVTSAIEVDMSKVVAIRDRLKPEYQRSYGVNLTYLAFVARATVETLRDWPWVNAELRGESIV